MIALDLRPRLAPKARLRFDRHSGNYLLLYPERALALNTTAAAIVAHCDGVCTVAVIADRVARDCGEPPALVLAAIQHLLAALADLGLLEEG